VIARICLIVDLTFTDVTVSTATEKPNKRQLIVRSKWTARQELKRCIYYGGIDTNNILYQKHYIRSIGNPNCLHTRRVAALFQ
jgi:hypothetical protein